MSNTKSMTRVLWVVVPLVVLLWAATPFVIFYISGDQPGAGTIGDSFGAINALFSSLAFALLIYTALMQRKELELQREELKLTREEMAKSAVAQSEMASLQNKQLVFERRKVAKEVRPRFEVYNSGGWEESNGRCNFNMSLILQDNDIVMIGVKLGMIEPSNLFDPTFKNNQLTYLPQKSTVVISLVCVAERPEKDTFSFWIRFSDKEDYAVYEQEISYWEGVGQISPPYLRNFNNY